MSTFGRVVPADDLPDSLAGPVSNAVPADDLPDSLAGPVSNAVPADDLPDVEMQEDPSAAYGGRALPTPKDEVSVAAAPEREKQHLVTVPKDKIEQLAKEHGADPAVLREWLPLLGGHEEGTPIRWVDETLGQVSNVLDEAAFAGLMTKGGLKAQGLLSGPKDEAALDALRAYVTESKSTARKAAEIGIGVFTPVAGLGRVAKGVEAIAAVNRLGKVATLGSRAAHGAIHGAAGGTVLGAAGSIAHTGADEESNVMAGAGYGAITGGALGAAAGPVIGALKSRLAARQPGATPEAGQPGSPVRTSPEGNYIPDSELQPKPEAVLPPTESLVRDTVKGLENDKNIAKFEAAYSNPKDFDKAFADDDIRDMYRKIAEDYNTKPTEDHSEDVADIIKAMKEHGVDYELATVWTKYKGGIDDYAKTLNKAYKGNPIQKLHMENRQSTGKGLESYNRHLEVEQEKVRYKDQREAKEVNFTGTDQAADTAKRFFSAETSELALIESKTKVPGLVDAISGIEAKSIQSVLISAERSTFRQANLDKHWKGLDEQSRQAGMDLLQAVARTPKGPDLRQDISQVAASSKNSVAYTPAVQEATAKTLEYYDSLREFYAKLGQTVDQLHVPVKTIESVDGVATEVTKMVQAHYVPGITKGTKDYQTAVYEWAKGRGDPTFKAVLTGKGEVMMDRMEVLIAKQVDKTLSAAEKDFIQAISLVTGKPFKNAHDLAEGIKGVLRGSVHGAGTEDLMGSMMMQRDHIPDFVKENDPIKLAAKSEQAAISHFTKDEGLRKMEYAKGMLKAQGHVGAATYIDRHQRDIRGGREKTIVGVWKNHRNRLQSRLMQMSGDQRAKGNILTANFLSTASEFPTAFNFMHNTMYTNLLTTPKTVLVDILQPFAKHLPALTEDPKSFWETTKTITAAFKDVWGGKAGQLSGVGSSYKQLIGDLTRRGYWSPDDRKLTQIAVRDGLKQGGMFNHAAQKFHAAESMVVDVLMHQRKVLTTISMRTGEKMIGQLQKEGNAWGMKQGSSLEKVWQQLPTSVRASAIRHLHSGNTEAASDSVGHWINSAHTVNYTNASKSEFARTLGPVFSAFTKWPTVAYGEVRTNIAQSRSMMDLFKREFKDHGAAFATLFAASEMVDEDSPIHRALLGKEGLLAASHIGSLKTFASPDVVQPPGLAVASGIKDIWNGEPSKAVKKAADLYVPGMWVARLFGEKSPMIFDATPKEDTPLASFWDDVHSRIDWKDK